MTVIYIKGTVTNILSRMTGLGVRSETYAQGRGLGAQVDTTSKINLNYDGNVNIQDARIVGFETLNTIASAKPTSKGGQDYNIDAYSFSHIKGIGDAESRAYLYGHINVSTLLGGGTDLVGRFVTVDANSFNGSKNVKVRYQSRAR